MATHPPKPFVPRTPATRELERYKDQFKEWYIDEDYTLPQVQQLFKDRYGLDVELTRWERRRRQWNILKTRSAGPSNTALDSPVSDAHWDGGGTQRLIEPQITYDLSPQPTRIAPSSPQDDNAISTRYGIVQRPLGYGDAPTSYSASNDVGYYYIQSSWHPQTPIDSQSLSSHRTPPQQFNPAAMPYPGGYPMARQGVRVQSGYGELPDYQAFYAARYPNNPNWYNQ